MVLSIIFIVYLDMIELKCIVYGLDLTWFMLNKAYLQAKQFFCNLSEGFPMLICIHFHFCMSLSYEYTQFS